MLGWHGRLPKSTGHGPDLDPNWDDWDGSNWESRFNVFNDDDEFAESDAPLYSGDDDLVDGDYSDLYPLPEGDPMEDTSPRLEYNPDQGSVMVHTGGPSMNIEGIFEEIKFQRVTPEGDLTLALWLDQPQADVLAKMIRHILEKVPIRPESQELLRGILPQVEALLEQHGTG